MTEKVNYIGAEYRASFESVVQLVSSGCLDGSGLDIAVEREGRDIRIRDRRSGAVFVCGNSTRRSSENPIAMTGEGATWFAALRGETCEFPNSAWLAFIEKVATAYHKRYSLVEYRQRKRKKEELEAFRNYGQSFSANFAETFFPQIGNIAVILPPEGSGEDVYGVSVRLGLSGGTGEAQPVLGRVYFRRDGDRMFPIESSVANQFESYISEAVLSEESEQVASSSGRGETVIRTTLNALNDLIYPRSGVSRFASCLCFSKKPGERESADEHVIKELTEKMLNARKTLECKSVKVLGITHVKWENTVLDIVAKGKHVFRVLFGPNGSVTLSCLNCRDPRPLIENNIVSYGEGEEKVSVAIDPRRKDFGLDKATIETLRDKVFSSHLAEITCKVRGTACSRLACASQTVSLGSGGGKCMNCPYPEIVWRDEEGTAFYTPDLAFASDRMTLVPKEKADRCVCCGRTYSKENMTASHECRFCGVLSRSPDEEGKKRAQENYKRYAAALPVRVRLRALGKTKYCFEDDSVLLFVLNGRRYILDKLEIRSVGYVPRATRIKWNGGGK